MFQRRFNRKTAAARLRPRNTKLISEQIYLAADTLIFTNSFALWFSPRENC